jgi:hypothetical protein
MTQAHMDRRLLELAILTMMSTLLCLLALQSDRPLIAGIFLALTTGAIALSGRFFS